MRDGETSQEMSFFQTASSEAQETVSATQQLASTSSQEDSCGAPPNACDPSGYCKLQKAWCPSVGMGNAGSLEPAAPQIRVTKMKEDTLKSMRLEFHAGISFPGLSKEFYHANQTVAGDAAATGAAGSEAAAMGATYGHLLCLVFHIFVFYWDSFCTFSVLGRGGRGDRRCGQTLKNDLGHDECVVGVMEDPSKRLVLSLSSLPSRKRRRFFLPPPAHARGSTVGDFLQKAGVRYKEVQDTGAVIAVGFYWNCDVRGEGCVADLSIKRMDGGKGYRRRYVCPRTLI